MHGLFSRGWLRAFPLPSVPADVPGQIDIAANAVDGPEESFQVPWAVKLFNFCERLSSVAPPLRLQPAQARPRVGCQGAL
eukprot:11129364-Alexandrium_andersonii.AAC.1